MVEENSASGRMAGRRVLVTGSGTGIGRGVALEFAREGADVVFHYSRSAAGANEALEEAQQWGGQFNAFKADFTKAAEAQALGKSAVDFLGGIDVLVNNVGVTANIPLGETTFERFDQLFNINFKSMYFLIQTVVPVMIEQKSGVIINVSSVHAYASMTEHSVYDATKGAINALTREMALELGHKGIRTNAIAPGWILVENQKKVLSEEHVRKGAETIPVGFIGEPWDVGRLAVFLASEDARFIIGQTIVIDGGQTCILPNTGDFRKSLGFRWGEDYVK
jgi:3-oxoacyl-[acyl-carrier protein] reductase